MSRESDAYRILECEDGEAFMAVLESDNLGVTKLLEDAARIALITWMNTVAINLRSLGEMVAEQALALPAHYGYFVVHPETKRLHKLASPCNPEGVTVFRGFYFGNQAIPTLDPVAGAIKLRDIREAGE